MAAQSDTRAKTPIVLTALAAVAMVIVFARMRWTGVPTPSRAGSLPVACAEPGCGFQAEWSAEDELVHPLGGDTGDRFQCPRCGKHRVFYTGVCSKCGKTYVGRNLNMRCPHCGGDPKPRP